MFTSMHHWVARRRISLAAHIIFLLVPLGAGTLAAFTVWTELFGSPWVAVGLIATLEVLALSSLILYIGRIQWPLAWLRHIIPFFWMVPLGYELYRYLAPQMEGWLVGAGVLALVVTGWLVFLAFQLLHSLERLFIDPVEAVRERAIEQMEGLRTTLSSWQEASGAVQSFVQGVQATAPYPQLPEQPTMPLLQAPADSHPKMQRIVGLAALQNANGTWALSIADIQRETRVATEVVEIVVKLVRTGQLVVVEGGRYE